MTWKMFFASSIGKKITMGLTGFFLIIFLIVHCSVNSMIFFNDGGETFNHWGHFLGTNLITRVMEIGLFVFLLLHVVQGLILWNQNRNARPAKYQVNDRQSNSEWYSRSMGLLGTLILIFLVLHWYHFWIPARFTGQEYLTAVTYNGVEMHDMFNLMKFTFSHLWVVIVYVLACISLLYHLLHGFKSSFRTIGVHNKKWFSLIKSVGVGYSILVSLLFALMPVAMYLNWV